MLLAVAAIGSADEVAVAFELVAAGFELLLIFVGVDEVVAVDEVSLRFTARELLVALELKDVVVVELEGVIVDEVNGFVLDVRTLELELDLDVTEVLLLGELLDFGLIAIEELPDDELDCVREELGIGSDVVADDESSELSALDIGEAVAELADRVGTTEDVELEVSSSPACVEDAVGMTLLVDAALSGANAVMLAPKTPSDPPIE